jgi:glucosamine--fructose-6-phosphate aminotransferase (isomerizing)
MQQAEPAGPNLTARRLWKDKPMTKPQSLQASSKMAEEVREIPLAVQRLLREGGQDIRAAALAARALDPSFIATVARGSSDHAATYLKYAAELTLGLPVASIGPSVASIYGAQLKLAKALCISVSQSGQSPDIVEMARSARAGGAMTVAVTNNAQSRLAGVSDRTLNIHAGPELSVAATKTFVTSVVALLALVAEWEGNEDLRRAIAALPDVLEKAAAIDWPELSTALAGAGSLFTLGRGPAYAISGEAALKFKEVSQIHAESYSSAEVLHGPVSIVGSGFPVLAFAAGDAAEMAVVDVADEMAAKGASVFVTSGKARHATRLEFVRSAHPLTDPLALIVSFYASVERFARTSGIDPDVPRHLKKVTETT